MKILFANIKSISATWCPFLSLMPLNLPLLDMPMLLSHTQPTQQTQTAFISMPYIPLLLLLLEFQPKKWRHHLPASSNQNHLYPDHPPTSLEQCLFQGYSPHFAPPKFNSQPSCCTLYFFPNCQLVEKNRQKL